MNPVPTYLRLLTPSLVLALGACAGEDTTEPGPSTDCDILTVEEDVTADTTWSCARVDVTESIGVEAALTVVPGVEVVFASGVSLEVSAAGSLNAVGTEAQPIVFRGDSATKSFWGGITIRSNRAENELRFVEIRDTGAVGFQFNEVGLRVTGRSIDVARLSMTDSTIANAGAVGLWVDAGGILDEFDRNTFEDVDGIPVQIPTPVMDAVGADNRLADLGNAEPYVGITGEDVESSITVAALDVPYRFLEDVSPRIMGGSTVMSVEAGAVIEFDAGAGLYADEGALSAEGTAEAPIVFRGSSPSAGTWEGLAFSSDRPENVLRFVEVRGGGAPGVTFDEYCVRVTGPSISQGSLTLEDSTLAACSNAGLYVDRGGRLTGFARNTFEGIEGYPVDLHFDIVDALDAASSYAGGAGEQENLQPFVNVRADAFVGSGTLQSLDVPYLLADGRYDVGDEGTAGDLTVSPGAELRFDESHMLVVAGTLKAQGTEAEPILFTGADAAENTWGGLAFQTTGDNVLDHVTVEYTGASGYQFNRYGIWVTGGGLPNGNLTLTNSTIRNNGGGGGGDPDPAVFVADGGTLTESDNTYSGNAGGDVVREM